MKNTIVHPLAPHSPAAPRLHHVTLNTGHVAEHEMNGIHSVSACDFLALLEQRFGEVPGMPGFGFAFSQATNCWQFILSRRGSELVTGGLAWGPGDGESLWRWLADFYNQRAPQIPAWRSSCPLTPPAMPWLGVVLSLNLGLISPDHARMLGAAGRAYQTALARQESHTHAAGDNVWGTGKTADAQLESRREVREYRPCAAAGFAHPGQAHPRRSPIL